MKHYGYKIFKGPNKITMNPAIGEKLLVPPRLQKPLDEIFLMYNNEMNKALALTLVENTGKISTLTYGKLSSRAYRIAHLLITKTFRNGKEICSLKFGDRVALIYLNNDPINFMCAFYGCLLADMVPVPIEAPLARCDGVVKEAGVLLLSCNIRVALTSEACLKYLPKTLNGEVLNFNGWPKLLWFVTDDLPKVPKEWCCSRKRTDDSPAYIEQTFDKNGSVMGVTVSRSVMYNQCRMLSSACGYIEGENLVCVIDIRRNVGLWHCVITSVLNAMHVIFIPQAVVKSNPLYWIHIISKYKATAALATSRDLQRTLLGKIVSPEISLSTLRLLIVGDGANPWSFPISEEFLQAFQPFGLRASAICPCAASDECLTVSIRRPVLGVVDTANSTFYDGLFINNLLRKQSYYSQLNCGLTLPGSNIAIVKMEGPPYLCEINEIGEICVVSTCTGSEYWSHPDLTKSSTFSVSPISSDGQPISDVKYTRSNLLGFLGPGCFVFICGSCKGLMIVNDLQHNADDIVATVLSVEKNKYNDPGQIAVFSIGDRHEEKMCVVAEQHLDCDEEESLEWMLKVLRTVHSIHQVCLYCLALVPSNYLPKYPSGDIHASQCKRRFLEGTLHPSNVLLCKPWGINTEKRSSSTFSSPYNSIQQGNFLVSTQGVHIMNNKINEGDPLYKFQFILQILEWRSTVTPEEVIFTLLNSKGGIANSLTCSQLYNRAQYLGSLIGEKALISAGNRVALIFPPGIDLICAFYGCLYIGVVPVVIKPPDSEGPKTNAFKNIIQILEISKSVIILASHNIAKSLKGKAFSSSQKNSFIWPLIVSIDELPKRWTATYKPTNSETVAYMDFSLSSTGKLTGITMSHKGTVSLCRSLKLTRELYALKPIVLCLDPYSGLGLVLWCLSSVYSGHHSILIPPSELVYNPELWLSAITQHAVRDTFCSYEVMEFCTDELKSTVDNLKGKGISLAGVRACVVVGERRPNTKLISKFSKIFSTLGLSSRAVSTSFGCRVNVAVCLQNASSPEPLQIYVDRRALRNDKVLLIERGSEYSECLLESGKVLPGVKLIIVNPETKEQCSDSQLGEIWVKSSHNACGYSTKLSRNDDHLTAKLSSGNTDEIYARTGYLGFIIEVQSPHPSPAGLDMTEKKSTESRGAVFVVGSLDETFMFNGIRYCHIFNKY